MDIFGDLRDRNERKRDQRAIRSVLFKKVDSDNNLLFSEFMSYGSLYDYISKVSTKELTLPNRALWRILCCCDDSETGDLRTETIPEPDTAEHAVVHFDIDPQNDCTLLGHEAKPTIMLL
ncbi:hypothetical protein SCUCBS95973_005689 [Sporothrix curviconia]|uniref:Protein kinase domain-containing protein n=1 Tax=Sporothrix curviconia TaxID=1260050 RepID=A0ABP0BZU5_9PEZI